MLLRLDQTAGQLGAKLVLLLLPPRQTLIAKAIRPAAQRLLVEYARNVGPPLRGRNRHVMTIR